MGAGIEDTMAVKSLQYNITPPVANLKEPDETLGELNYSTGQMQSYRYALRLAAGFGSQLTFCIWEAEAKGMTVLQTQRGDWHGFKRQQASSM